MNGRRTVTITLAALVAGCGLVSGLDGLHVGGDVDGSSEAGSEGGLACDGGCGFSLPAGFALVTFATALPAACPSGTNPQTVVADPTVASDACSCKCTMTTKGTCTAANVQVEVGDGGLSSCTNLFTILSGAAGCHPTSLTFAGGTRIDSAGAVLVDAGVCGTSSVADASTLATTPAQVCVPTSCAASETLCAPPPGQRLCVATAGDVSCPDPFTEKHLVGADASVACSTCGSACTINAQQCNGHLTLYSDTACKTIADNASSCFSIGNQAITVKSYDYSATASGGCTTTATSSASPVLDAEQTVCCRPGT